MSQDQLSRSEPLAPVRTSADDMPGSRIEVGVGDSGGDIVARLNLPQVGKEGSPKTVIVLVGATDLANDESHARLVQLFGRGLAKAANSNSALVIDASRGDEAAAALSRAMFGGNDNALLIKVSEDGQAAAGSAGGTTTMGASNAPKACYSHYISSKSGVEMADVVNKIVSELGKTLSVLTLLVNGGAQEKDVVVHCVRRGWQVMVMQDSEGLAKEICDKWSERIDYLQQLAAWKSRPTTAGADNQKQPVEPFVDDLLVSEIITSSNLCFFAIGDPPEKLALCIKQRFEATTLLDKIHKQQKVYSHAASQEQRIFRRQQNFILLLGVVITGTAVLQTLQNQNAQTIATFLAAVVAPLQLNLKPQAASPVIEVILRFALVAIPALVTVLIAGSNRFNPGNRWVMLRTASEIYKREMFRYRTRTGIYSDVQVTINKIPREAILTRTLESSSKQWIESSLDSFSFPGLLEAAGGTPKTSWLERFMKRLSALIFRSRSRQEDSPSLYLTTEGYIRERLIGQLIFYSKNIRKLEGRLKFLQWLILVLGGVITVLGALNIALPITVITAVATALGGYLEYTQVSNTLKQYKHVSVTLISLQNWWDGLGDAQADPLNIDKIVEYVETTLQTEQAGWVQQMQAALTDLRAQQAKQSGDHADDGSFLKSSPGANGDKVVPVESPQEGLPPDVAAPDVVG